MDMMNQPAEEPKAYSRRSVVRKAAYTAPAVIAIAAAPQVALGHSGPRKPKGGKGHGKGKGYGKGNGKGKGRR